MRAAYNLDKIKFATDGPTFERAVSLYESGKVTQFKEDFGGHSAVVSGARPYRVFVSARHSNFPSFDPYCSTITGRVFLGGRVAAACGCDSELNLKSLTRKGESRSRNHIDQQVGCNPLLGAPR